MDVWEEVAEDEEPPDPEEEAEAAEEEEEAPEVFPAFLYSFSRVWVPASPSAFRETVRWNFLTAFSVFVPKIPSAVPPR